MAQCRLIVFFAALSCIAVAINASAGDADPIYKACVKECEKTGCVTDKCFQHCKFSSDGIPIDGRKREKLGDKPVKYHGKWPLWRVYGIQEPISVALSALNLAMQFHGWVSFFILVNYNLPLRPNKRTYYEFTGLLHLYGLLAMNSWFWGTVFHSRDVELTEKLDYSSAVALLGFSLIVSILRAFSVRDEASRVMVAAPLIAFVSTHILYLNFYQLDYGLNKKVCVGMGVAQLLIWAVWAYVTHHPSRWKLWVVVIGGSLVMLLEIYDFPPYWKFVDAHAIRNATAIPLTFLWWSFIRDDAEFRTSTLLKKAK
ncbi:Per1-like family protein [Actinidia rufa]|uniref:Post-GPI attachment to proteins factor 3 n=1 Tax=Actinidia rufa TaxID=165716 RepID=A0A7J0EF63_9ERIC|nr:Per1-like family protein [Actinidia rufa]